MTDAKEKKSCFMCSHNMPTRTGMYLKIGGKLRFVCEQCRNTICRPLPKSQVDSAP